MKYRKKPIVVEANQFLLAATAPIGTRTREDGSVYVKTINGDELTLARGDWVIMEHDGVHAYPCKPDVFISTYEPAMMAD
jgi:hypothetical protein